MSILAAVFVRQLSNLETCCFRVFQKTKNLRKTYDIAKISVAQDFEKGISSFVWKCGAVGARAFVLGFRPCWGGTKGGVARPCMGVRGYNPGKFFKFTCKILPAEAF
jgi:hypothetical protein